MADASSAPRHGRGLIVVIVLGVIFFALLATVVIFAGKHPAEASAPSEGLSVLPAHLRIRTEPSAKAPVVASATEGEKLVVVEDRGAWVRVQDPDGLTGWAERNSLERTSERERRMARYEAIKKLPPLAGVTTQSTPLYAGPGIFYPLLGDLGSHARVKVYTRDHDFYAVDHEGEIAYVDIDAIDVTAAGSPQLDVRTTTAANATAATETAASASSSTGAPPVETSPPPPESAPPVEVARGDRGVYSAVPPGGTQPEEIDRVVPRYPIMARQHEVAGAVVIRGIVRKDGTIDDVEVIKDLPYNLGEAAREAVEQWRFRPATYRGDPIDVYYTVTVNFRLR